MIDLAPRNPYSLLLDSLVLAAAGCFGYGVEYARMIDPTLIGGLVTRTTTLRPIRGTPRIEETAAGLVWDGRIVNPGLDAVIDRYAPRWVVWPAPVILSVTGENPAAFTEIAAALETVEGVAALELNLLPLTDNAPACVAAARRGSPLPLLAKLPPLATLPALAAEVVAAGADALVIAGPPPAAVPRADGSLLHGWLCGPAIRPLALAHVAAVAAAVDVPVIGCGGIATADDARAMLAAGATAVQIGAALLADPFTLPRLRVELGGE